VSQLATVTVHTAERATHLVRFPVSELAAFSAVPCGAARALVGVNRKEPAKACVTLPCVSVLEGFLGVPSAALHVVCKGSYDVLHAESAGISCVCQGVFNPRVDVEASKDICERQIT